MSLFKADQRALQTWWGRGTGKSRMRGTSLVEVLVVIVVFAIGILAVAQIFPGGYRLLNISRATSAAHALARSLDEQLVGNVEGVPEAILPVRYEVVAGALRVLADENRRPTELNLLGTGMDPNGNVLQGGTILGYWPYFSGANVMRRVIGETHRVPAPRAVGNFYGGLLVLNFGPVLTDMDDFLTGGTFEPLFEIYGSDMERKEGPPPAEGAAFPYEFFIEAPEGSTALLHLPRAQAAAGVAPRAYRVTMTVYVTDATSMTVRRDIQAVFEVDSDPALRHEPIAIGSDPRLAGQLSGGDVFLSVVPESIRIARRFRQTAVFSDDPYEYRLINWKLGLVLFNDRGYNYFEYRNSGRRPMVARVSYDVFDWRILKDDFRVPAEAPYQTRLAIGGIKGFGAREPDGKVYAGLNVPLPDGAGGVENREYALIDVETGGIYTPDSFRLDRQLGVVTFLDTDGGTAGLQSNLVLPGAVSTTSVNASGRSIRALYQVTGYWAAHPLKAAASYRQAYGRPGPAQFYVGGSSPLGGNTRRIYFPWADLGQKVSIGEIWYLGTDSQTHRIANEDFLIQATPADPLGLPYIDISDKRSDVVDLDWTTHGFAAREVKGASVSVRVLWNPTFFTLSGDSDVNVRSFEEFRTAFRRSISETAATGGERP